MQSALNRKESAKVEEFTDELAPGTSLLHGQYKIESFLNSGGFGLTYLARDSLDRIVVIKECFPGSLCSRQDRKVRARSRTQADEFRAIVRLFVQEARRLAKLDHPNIVGVHQVFEDNETAYMALDFVDGQDLHEICENDPERLNPEKIVDILKKTLEAVSFIHDQHILHRDISPDNILLDANDNPVLIDFGAAREKATKASRTLSSLLVVKDGYSPQEFYIEGSQQGPASDLYALGATFYHILTGAPPPNSHARLSAAASDETDPYLPLAGRSNLFSPEFLSAIDRSLSIFPKDRHQSALEWLEEIDSEKRREAAIRKAQSDLNMEREISKLVEETNKAVLELRRLEEQRQKELATRPQEEKKQRKPFFSWQLEDDEFSASDDEQEDEKPLEDGIDHEDGIGDGDVADQDQDTDLAARTADDEAGAEAAHRKRRSLLDALRPRSVLRLLTSRRDRSEHLGKAEL